MPQRNVRWRSIHVQVDKLREAGGASSDIQWSTIQSGAAMTVYVKTYRRLRKHVYNSNSTNHTHTRGN